MDFWLSQTMRIARARDWWEVSGIISRKCCGKSSWAGNYFGKSWWIKKSHTHTWLQTVTLSMVGGPPNHFSFSLWSLQLFYLFLLGVVWIQSLGIEGSTRATAQPPYTFHTTKHKLKIRSGLLYLDWRELKSRINHHIQPNKMRFCQWCHWTQR